VGGADHGRELDRGRAKWITDALYFLDREPNF